MSKIMTIIANNKEYTLEFTRRTVQRMEDNGFIVSELSDKPATMIPMLFSGAFLAHHKFVKREIIDEIYNSIKKKDELISKLVEMYQETITSLIGADDDDNTDEGDVMWESNF